MGAGALGGEGQRPMRDFRGIALLIAALWTVIPTAAEAQMEFSLDEVEEDAKPAGKSESQGDLIEELATADDAKDGPIELTPQREEIAEEIYAVQQIYALRLKRLELAPSVAFTLNDPYIKRYGLGFAMNYWFTNVLALGINFNWYDWGGNPLERGTDLEFRVRSQILPRRTYQRLAVRALGELHLRSLLREVQGSQEDLSMGLVSHRWRRDHADPADSSVRC